MRRAVSGVTDAVNAADGSYIRAHVRGHRSSTGRPTCRRRGWGHYRADAPTRPNPAARFQRRPIGMRGKVRPTGRNDAASFHDGA